MLFSLFSSSDIGDLRFGLTYWSRPTGPQAATSKLTISADDQKSEIAMSGIRKLNGEKAAVCSRKPIVSRWQNRCRPVWDSVDSRRTRHSRAGLPYPAASWLISG